MKIKLLAALCAAAVIAGAPEQADACGVFNVKAADGSVISARSMEFGYDIKSDLALVPRGTKFASPTPSGGKGLAWKTKYGFAGVTTAGDVNYILDGINEAGLAASGLWYDSVQWQEVTKKNDGKALSHLMLINWTLGKFATVQEVRQAVKRVKIFGSYLEMMKSVPPMHVFVTDASGAAIVIEAGNGTVNVFDNPVGVMTNAPDFPWMLSNLRNYTGMSNHMAAPQNFMGMPVAPTGHGSGMFGLPGDLTPPARFVRLAVTLRFADPAPDAKSALNLARHILNSVDIVRGMAVDLGRQGEVVSSETTEWSVLRDLKNRVLYFRTYDNLDLRKVELGRVDFKDGRLRRVALYGQAETITDLTPAN
ncbi:MAG: choloylglycine hydrolase family protein [Elusimicrobiaceae bacterium]|nr:choloylglycine hydrolase family protein [Elusimicrobiaceae bacterium]